VNHRGAESDEKNHGGTENHRGAESDEKNHGENHRGTEGGGK